MVQLTGASYDPYIVTNNVKDFKESTIPAITPLDFCDLLA